MVDLLRAVAETVEVPAQAIDSAKYLDRYYIPSRYPNGWASGSPFDFVTEKDASDAIAHSESILRLCESLLAR